MCSSPWISLLCVRTDWEIATVLSVGSILSILICVFIAIVLLRKICPTRSSVFCSRVLLRKAYQILMKEWCVDKALHHSVYKTGVSNVSQTNEARHCCCSVNLLPAVLIFVVTIVFCIATRLRTLRARKAVRQCDKIFAVAQLKDYIVFVGLLFEVYFELFMHDVRNVSKSPAKACAGVLNIYCISNF